MKVDTPVRDEAGAVPFASVFVMLTKQEHIELIRQARSWQSLHQRAVQRAQGAALLHQQQLRELRVQAAQREAELLAELELAQASVRDLKQRVFGRKSEQRKGGSQSRAGASGTPATRSRGHQTGVPGHGRSRQTALPERVEIVDLNEPHCPQCGLHLGEFPGTEDSEIVEIDVQAYRRVVRRKRYRPVCDCGCLSGIVTAPAAPRLIPRGKYGVSVWVSMLLDKFLYGRPSHRLLQDFAGHGLQMSPGTLAGGLRSIAPLFEPLEQALLTKLRSEQHWHADETRWAVFEATEGKVGSRHYLWVFHSPSVVHYVVDGSRAAHVIETELEGVASGILSCDRYSAYKRFARLNPGVVLAYCWAHQRRDYLELANSHPHLSPWAMSWVDEIGKLYHLNKLRVQSEQDSPERAEHHAQLQAAVQAMHTRLETQLLDAKQPEPALKVLQSMQCHWSGLVVFVDHPHVAMDNNTAERAARLAVVGRKNFYGSGAKWSAQLAATMYSLLMTVQLWGLNPRTWLTSYCQACAENQSQAPKELSAWLPWLMDEEQLSQMRRGASSEWCPDERDPIDSS